MGGRESEPATRISIHRRSSLALGQLAAKCGDLALGCMLGANSVGGPHDIDHGRGEDQTSPHSDGGGVPKMRSHFVLTRRRIGRDSVPPPPWPAHMAHTASNPETKNSAPWKHVPGARVVSNPEPFETDAWERARALLWRPAVADGKTRFRNPVFRPKVRFRTTCVPTQAKTPEVRLYRVKRGGYLSVSRPGHRMYIDDPAQSKDAARAASQRGHNRGRDRGRAAATQRGRRGCEGRGPPLRRWPPTPS